MADNGQRTVLTVVDISPQWPPWSCPPTLFRQWNEWISW